MDAGPSDTMIAALTDLWRLRPPGPENLLKTPAFLRLREACRVGYPNAGSHGPNFALSTALGALGLPCSLPPDAAALGLPVLEAAARLDAGLRATTAKRLYLAPLDLADELPEMSFGPARVLQPSAEKLRQLFDEPRLRRSLASSNLDAQRFSEFHWLIVEDTAALSQEPEARAVPILFMNLSEDHGRIEPHKGRFPTALEDALFFLLLEPWESLVHYPNMNWRGFRIPWVHTVDEDLFAQQQPAPSPDTLDWQEQAFQDADGQTVEKMVPVRLPLEDHAAAELRLWDQARWGVAQEARKAPLFETPIVHFFVRAFLADGVDEVLAHMTTIEAALGLHADYKPSERVFPDRHKGMKATNRMGGPVAGLLGNGGYAAQYEQLFNVRSAFLHGRTMNAISSSERVLARTLARQVVEALVCATLQGPVTTREAFLDHLLDRGAPML